MSDTFEAELASVRTPKFVAPATIQTYPLPAPGPEDRERYWELKPLAGAS